MHKSSLILCALLLMMLAVMPTTAQPATPEATPEAISDSQVVITLQRTACNSTCRVYTVKIFTDGTVVYNGERYVTVMGEQIIHIDPALIEPLVEDFASVGYFDWNDSYTDMDITDMPTVTTSVTHDGVTKQIVRYVGDESVPITLPILEGWIDEVAQTEQWTGADSRENTVGAGQWVIMLSRTGCEGSCPDYGLVIYADGTVVYYGGEDVAVLGKRVSKIDPAAVEALIQQAKSIGYFNWSDEYSDSVTTDRTIVYTSVQSADDFNQIARFDGDPNAPIGLVRFEDRIGAAVNVDQWVKAPD